jgi:hypothetical protein
MADEKKNKPKRIISPKFTAMYAWLSAPNTKHDKDGVYQVSGKFDPKVPEQRAFLKVLSDMHKANVEESRKGFKATKKQPEMKVQPPIHEEDDGTYRVNFKEAAFIIPEKGPHAGKKIDLKPPVVDATGKPANEIEVWSGSEVKVAIDVAPFYNGSLGAGLSLRLKGVQVITLRTRGSRDGASLGFTAEEGFTADGGNGAPDFSSDTDTPVEDTADDFLSDDTGNGEDASETPAAAPAKSDNYDF